MLLLRLGVHTRLNPGTTKPRHSSSAGLQLFYIYERKEEEGETFQKVYKERSPVAMWRHWPGRPARRLHQPSSGHKETWQKLRDNFLQFDFNQQPFLNNTISRSFPEEIIFPLDLRLSSFQFSSFPAVGRLLTTLVLYIYPEKRGGNIWSGFVFATVSFHFPNRENPPYN